MINSCCTTLIIVVSLNWKKIREWGKSKKPTIFITSIWYIYVDSGQRAKTEIATRAAEIDRGRKERNGASNAAKSQEIRSWRLIHQ